MRACTVGRLRVYAYPKIFNFHVVSETDIVENIFEYILVFSSKKIFRKFR